MSECRGCEREIEWAVVEGSGRKMPLDPLPDPEGNVVLVGRTDAESGLPIVRVLATGTLPMGELIPPGERRRSHFQTCPDAESFRR